MKLVIWLQIPAAGGGVALLNPAIGVLTNLYGNVNVLGAVLDAPTEISIVGVRTLNKQELKNLDYDIILVAGDKASLVPIIQQADELGIDIDKTVLDRTVCVPLFTMEKYNKLRHSRLSVFSTTCFAGLLYHRFGLPFLSPTINMFTSNEGFFKLLENPIENMAQSPILHHKGYNSGLRIDYPVYKIGETKWSMNHYSDFDEALQKWRERRDKINWFNLMVVMYTEDVNDLIKFDRLPFAKKVCYVPFKTNLSSGFSIKLEDYPDKQFYQIVNESAIGSVVNYDIWDMLLYGKKTPLKVVNR